jgi:hypothetical protein
MKRFLLALCLLIGMHAPGFAGVDLSNIDTELPPVIADTTAAAGCTVTYLLEDVATNDITAVRMKVARDANDRVSGDRLPCPKDVPPRVGTRAMEECIRRAGDPKTCVFADMARDFEKRPTIALTAENASRCSSDKSTDIGLACWHAGTFDVCAVACGDSPEKAVATAINRCESKHQRQCPVSGSLPVLAPQ